MSGSAIALLILWLILSALSLWHWLPAGRGPAAAMRATRPVKVATLTVVVVLIGVCAILSVLSGPLNGPWRWVAGAVGVAITLLGGGALTTIILALASSTTSASARVQREVLRGGAWIGALERLAVLGTLMSGWPEGLAVIVAIKGLARYPELRTASSAGSGASERFIIGTLASLGWAAACAWVLANLL